MLNVIFIVYNLLFFQKQNIFTEFWPPVSCWILKQLLFLRLNA